MSKNTKLVIVLVIFIVVMTIGAIMIINNNSDSVKIDKADKKVTEAFDSLPVYVNGSMNEINLLDFIQEYNEENNNEMLDAVELKIDLNEIFDKVDPDDVELVKNKFAVYYQKLYNDLEVMFQKTNNLTIDFIKFDVKKLEEYQALEEINLYNITNFPLTKFLEKNETVLFFIYGDFKLSLCAEFFNGKNSQEFERAKKTPLYMTFVISNQQNDDMYLEIDVHDDNRSFYIDRPGKSILVQIPLELLNDPVTNRPRYNAVQYYNKNNDYYKTLPRSLCDDKYLNVSANRTGRYRFIETEHGNTNNKKDFLHDRGIDLKNNQFVTRGEFYYSLMEIYWTETLNIPVYKSWRDVNIDNDYALKYNIGRELGILVGYEDERDDLENSLKPDQYIERCEIFAMLVRFIDAFSLNVKNRMRSDPNVTDLPSSANEAWWYEYAIELTNDGFIPYRIIDGKNTISGDQYAYLNECEDIFYNLITSIDF